MTVAHHAETPSAPPSPPAPPGGSGRERRSHHRREAIRVWAQVDGGWYRVHDLSLGGLGLDRPVDGPGVGGVIDGEIHSRAGDRPRQITFKATVVRADESENRIGVSFAPMEAEQIDGLLAILSAVEREYVAEREAELRREAMQQRLRRLAIGGAVAVAIVAAGIAVSFMRS